jgi:hypothetical protein
MSEQNIGLLLARERPRVPCTPRALVSQERIGFGCATVAGIPSGRIGFVVQDGQATVEDVRAWAMSLEP